MFGCVSGRSGRGVLVGPRPIARTAWSAAMVGPSVPSELRVVIVGVG